MQKQFYLPEAHTDFVFSVLAEELGIPLLGRIPLVQSIRENGDDGAPAALSSRPDGLAFLELAGKLAEIV